MTCFPNAKINIGLRITGKRKDGFHNIESVFYPIPLAETLEFVEAPEFRLSLSGKPVPGNLEDNLLFKAFHFFQEKFQIPNLHIYLNKQIPMGAGLGGGSADLAFFVRELNTNFNVGLGFIELESIVAQWSSDAPFFIRNTPAWVSGRGEVLSPLDFSLKGKYLTLVNPGIHVSTKEAYAGVTPVPAKPWKEVVLQGIEHWNDCVINDFEKSVMAQYPTLAQLKLELQQTGASFVQMSGSGSSFFALSNEPLDLEDLSNKYALVKSLRL